MSFKKQNVHPPSTATPSLHSCLLWQQHLTKNSQGAFYLIKNDKSALQRIESNDNLLQNNDSQWQWGLPEASVPTKTEKSEKKHSWRCQKDGISLKHNYSVLDEKYVYN